jgi:hypothetical protein
MTKKTAFVLLAALLIAFLPVGGAFACSANCMNGSCTGTGSCKCVGGDPICIDQTGGDTDALIAQADYARSFNVSGLNRFADATDHMANALIAGDQDAYFLSILEREAALKSLSPREQKMLNSWDGGDQKPTKPATK